MLWQPATRPYGDPACTYPLYTTVLPAANIAVRASSASTARCMLLTAPMQSWHVRKYMVTGHAQAWQSLYSIFLLEQAGSSLADISGGMKYVSNYSRRLHRGQHSAQFQCDSCHQQTTEGTSAV